MPEVVDRPSGSAGRADPARCRPPVTGLPGARVALGSFFWRTGRAGCIVWPAPGFVPGPDALRGAGTVASGMATMSPRETVAMKQTDMSRTARGGGYAVQTAGLARRVRRPYRSGPGGPAGPGRDGVRLSEVRRRREDHADPDTAGADDCDVRVGAAAGAPGPGGALGCAFAGGAMAGEPRFLRPTSRIQMQRLGPSSRPATTGRVPAVFRSVRDSLSAPAPPGPSGCLSVTSPGIIPCISRAISAQDEADGLPAVRFFRRGKSRVSGLSGGSLYPGLVPGAARRGCRILLLHKVKCPGSCLGSVR